MNTTPTPNRIRLSSNLVSKIELHGAIAQLEGAGYSAAFERAWSLPGGFVPIRDPYIEQLVYEVTMFLCATGVMNRIYKT